MNLPRRRATRLRATHYSHAGTELVELHVLAREAGLHPEAVSRFVALGLLEPAHGPTGTPLFQREGAARLARAARLRRELGLNYAGAVLACELLAQIERLELELEGTRQMPDDGLPDDSERSDATTDVEPQ